jgi:hypothetical protein
MLPSHLVHLEVRVTACHQYIPNIIRPEHASPCSSSLKTLFPCLSTLILDKKTTDSIILANTHFPAHLPTSLQHLALVNLGSEFKLEHLCNALPNLTHLELEAPLGPIFLPQHLTYLQLRNCLSFEGFDTISSLSSLSTLHIESNMWRFHGSESHRRADFLKFLPPTLTELDVVMPIAPGNLIESLPRSLTHLKLRQRESFWVHDLSGKLPPNLTWLNISAFYNHNLRMRDTSELLPFLLSLPRSLTYIHHTMPSNAFGNLEDMQALPPSLAHFDKASLDLLFCKYGFLPPNLEEMSVYTMTRLAEEDLHHFPRSLTSLRAPIQLSSLSAPSILRSFNRLRHLKGLKIARSTEPTKDQNTLDWSAEQASTSLTGDVEQELELVNLDHFIPPSTRDISLTLDHPEVAHLSIDFGSCGLSFSLQKLIIQSEHQLYGTSKVRAGSMLSFSEQTTLPNLEELQFTGVLHRQNLATLSHWAPQLQVLRIDSSDVSLTNEHLRLLPRTLRNIEILKPRAEITVHGLYALPRYCHTCVLPDCPAVELLGTHPWLENIRQKIQLPFALCILRFDLSQLR